MISGFFAASRSSRRPTWNEMTYLKKNSGDQDQSNHSCVSK